MYVGFVHIKRLQQKLIDTILEERSLHGPYLHLQNFIERTAIGIEQLNILISIGALRFTGKSKKRLLWEANFLQKNNQPQLHSAPALFNEPPLEFELPELADDPVDDLYDQMEILGFTLTNPFELVDANPADHVAADALPQHKGRQVTCLAYFIAHKGTVTRNRDYMFFGTFIDSELNWIDSVHFPDVAKKYPLNSSGFYLLTGKVTEDFGVYSLEVSYMKKIGYKNRSYTNFG